MFHMSFQITTAFIKQYSSTIERLLQQTGSRFLGTVRQESQASEEQFWEQIGSVEATEITERHGNSPLISTPHARRRVTLRAFDVGDMVDSIDKVQMLIDPTSTYIQNFVDALQRKRDQVIIESFFGTAFTGKAGTTTVAFPAGNVIPNNFGSMNATGMTIEKLIEARRRLLAEHNDPQSEPWYVAMSAQQLADLLNENKVQSADYNTIRALVRGEVDTFLGFKFIFSEYLPKSGNDRECPVWTKNGILHTVGKEIVTRLAERPDKRFSLYAYACAMFGATRMQEKKVLKILCTEPS